MGAVLANVISKAHVGKNKVTVNRKNDKPRTATTATANKQRIGDKTSSWYATWYAQYFST